MRRGMVTAVVLVALVAGACRGSGVATSSTTRVTVGPLGPLEAALLTQSQIRQVPGLSATKVTPLQDLAPFDDGNPRAPCGATVARLSLSDAVGVGISGDVVLGGISLIVRLPAGAAKRYLDARMADTSPGCAAFTLPSADGEAQRMQLVRVVRLHREFEQALAVVSALTTGERVRAATQIEVRRGDVLARTVISTNAPLPNVAVRGIAAVMGRNLRVFDS